MENSPSLADLKLGETACIQFIANRGPTGRRLLDLGFVPGAKVQALFTSVKGDPTAYSIKGTVIALRKEGATQIFLIERGQSNA